MQSGTDSLRGATPPRHTLPAWPQAALRRYSVDIHIPDWDPHRLARFDAEAYVSQIARAGFQSLLQYANSHTGLCLWRTAVGHEHGAMGGRDFFGEVVAACHRHGVHPLAYFSVIHDNWAFEHHQDWRVCNADNQTSTTRYGYACPNSPYRDYVRRCIGEIVCLYEVAGVFFDMTFWPATCYCRHCRARFATEQGHNLPRCVDWRNPIWRAFQRARQEWLYDFACLCTNAVRQERPGITAHHQFSTVFAPWRFGVPFKLSDACDFVGGDFYGGPTEHSLACKAYDGLTRTRLYEFHTSRTHTYTDHVTVKPANQLRAEIAVALLHGAAMMLVDYLNADGTLNPAVYEFLKPIVHWSEPYEQHLGGRMLANVALYVSKDSMYDPDENGVDVLAAKMGGLTPHTRAILGAARALRAAHIHFGVVTDARLAALTSYDVAFLPDVLEMTEAQAETFRAFVAKGGVLYASGRTSLGDVDHEPRRLLLQDVFGVAYAGTAGNRMTYLTPNKEWIADILWPQDHLAHPGSMLQARALEGAEVLGWMTLPFVDPELGAISAAASRQSTAIHQRSPPRVLPPRRPTHTARGWPCGPQPPSRYAMSWSTDC